MDGASPTPPQRILVSCLPGIGDTLLFFPALRALRSAWPDCHISALTMFQGARELLTANTDVDEVIHFDFVGSSAVSSFRFVLSLRQRRFDAVLLSYPANRLEYNLMTWLTGAPVRAGHRYKHRNRRCGNWLNTHSIEEDDALTNVRENLRLVETLTGARHDDTPVRLQLPRDAREHAEAWVSEHGLAGKCLVGVHPGGSTAKNHRHKRWPPKKFAQAVKTLQDSFGITALVFGGPEESDAKEEVLAGISGHALSVETASFLDTAAIMAHCEHFIANDTALLHVAGALAIPTTAIFGPTHADWVRIAGAPRTEVSLGLPCQPCFYYSPQHLGCRYGDFRCLTTLEAQRVADPVAEALSDYQAAQPGLGSP